jgi:hypothetical protein
MEGDKSFDSWIKIHSNECELVYGENRETNKGKRRTRPDKASFPLPDTDSSNQGNHDQGESMNSSKKRHNRILSDFFRGGQGIDRRPSFP